MQEEKQKKGLAAKLELAKFLQETIAEMARRNKAKAQTEDETQRFSTYVQKVTYSKKSVSPQLIHFSNPFYQTKGLKVAYVTCHAKVITIRPGTLTR